MIKLAQTMILLGCIAFSAHAFAKHEALLVFNSPADVTEVMIMERLKQEGTVQGVISLINQKLRLPKPLSFIFGGKDGPLYDPSLNEILIPYTFIDEVKARFVEAKYSETGVTPTEATSDALMHTLFHELGHALISMHQLPIVGKQEDAVDSLANVLLIEFYDQGQETVLSAADLFDLESGDVEKFEDSDFWDEHSLDSQRYYSALCHVYGSDPDNYASLIENANISEDRAELCIEEYETASRSWFKLLNLK